MTRIRIRPHHALSGMTGAIIGPRDGGRVHVRLTSTGQMLTLPVFDVAVEDGECPTLEMTAAVLAQREQRAA